MRSLKSFKSFNKKVKKFFSSVLLVSSLMGCQASVMPMPSPLASQLSKAHALAVKDSLKSESKDKNVEISSSVLFSYNKSLGLHNNRNGELVFDKGSIFGAGIEVYDLQSTDHSDDSTDVELDNKFQLYYLSASGHLVDITIDGDIVGMNYTLPVTNRFNYQVSSPPQSSVALDLSPVSDTTYSGDFVSGLVIPRDSKGNPMGPPMKVATVNANPAHLMRESLELWASLYDSKLVSVSSLYEGIPLYGYKLGNGYMIGSGYELSAYLSTLLGGAGVQLGAYVSYTHFDTELGRIDDIMAGAYGGLSILFQFPLPHMYGYLQLVGGANYSTTRELDWVFSLQGTYLIGGF